MILDILNSRKDISAINDTYISLIPKVKSAFYVKDFRSISLCNVTYKLVSKVIVNRLRASMSSVIHDSQNALVKNRLIIDNIIVSFEAFILWVCVGLMAPTLLLLN